MSKVTLFSMNYWCLITTQFWQVQITNIHFPSYSYLLNVLSYSWCIIYGCHAAAPPLCRGIFEWGFFFAEMWVKKTIETLWCCSQLSSTQQSWFVIWVLRLKEMQFLARRQLKQTVRLQDGQMGEAVKKNRGKAVFVICHSLSAYKSC